MIRICYRARIVEYVIEVRESTNMRFLAPNVMLNYRTDLKEVAVLKLFSGTVFE